MPQFVASRHSRPAIDPRLERGLRMAVAAGSVLSLLLPLRSDWFGLTPLWLLAMPLTAWWALHRFRLPMPAAVVARRRRRAGGQARRRNPLSAKRLLRAA